MAKDKNFNPDNQDLKGKIVHKSGSAGGMLVGKRHSNGGIKAINKGTGQPLEMEGGEVVITRNAVSDNKKRSFNGKMMTNREILSQINVSGGGVSFADGGEVPEDFKIEVERKEYEYGGKTVDADHLLYEMSKCGCDHDDDDEDIQEFESGGVINQKSIYENAIDKIEKENNSFVGGLLDYNNPMLSFIKLENNDIVITLKSYKELFFFFTTIDSKLFLNKDMHITYSDGIKEFFLWNPRTWGYNELFTIQDNDRNNRLYAFLQAVAYTLEKASNYNWTNFLKADPELRSFDWAYSSLPNITTSTITDLEREYPRLFNENNPNIDIVGFYHEGTRKAPTSISDLLFVIDSLVNPNSVAYVYVDSEKYVWSFRTVSGSKRNTSKQVNVNTFKEIPSQDQISRVFKYLSNKLYANKYNWSEFIQAQYLQVSALSYKNIFKDWYEFETPPEPDYEITTPPSELSKEIYVKDEPNYNFNNGEVYFLDGDQNTFYRVFKEHPTKPYFIDTSGGYRKDLDYVTKFQFFDDILVRPNDKVFLDGDSTEYKVLSVSMNTVGNSIATPRYKIIDTNSNEIKTVKGDIITFIVDEPKPDDRFLYREYPVDNLKKFTVINAENDYQFTEIKAKDVSDKTYNFRIKTENRGERNDYLLLKGFSVDVNPVQSDSTSSFTNINDISINDIKQSATYYLNQDLENVYKFVTLSNLGKTKCFVNVADGEITYMPAVKSLRKIDDKLIRVGDFVKDFSGREFSITDIGWNESVGLAVYFGKTLNGIKESMFSTEIITVKYKNDSDQTKIWVNKYENNAQRIIEHNSITYQSDTVMVINGTDAVNSDVVNLKVACPSSSLYSPDCQSFIFLYPFKFTKTDNEVASSEIGYERPLIHSTVRVNSSVFRVVKHESDGTTWEAINMRTGVLETFFEGQNYDRMISKTVPQDGDVITTSIGESVVEKVYFTETLLKMKTYGSDIFPVNRTTTKNIFFGIKKGDTIYKHPDYRAFEVLSVKKSSDNFNYTVKEKPSGKQFVFKDSDILPHKDFYIKKNPKEIEVKQGVVFKKYDTLTNEALANIQSLMDDAYRLSPLDYKLSMDFVNRLIAEKQMELQLDPVEYEGSLRLDLFKDLRELQKQKYNLYYVQNGGSVGVVYRMLERLHKGETYENLDDLQVLGNDMYNKDVIFTEKFKKWFGDWERAKLVGNNEGVSKAVNKEGFPQVYYNGSRRKKYTYRQESNGVFYLAESRSYADWFARNASSRNPDGNILMETYVRIENPIDLTPFKTDEYDFAEIAQYIATFYPSTRIYDFLPKKIRETIKEGKQTNFKLRAWQVIRQYPKLNKHIRLNTQYDGYFYMENNPSDQINGKQNITKACAVFKSSQVKLKNASLFNPVLDDFRFELGGELKGR